MWPSGQRTRAPCAVECDAPQEPGLKLGPGACPPPAEELLLNISNNSFARDEQGDNPRPEKHGSTVSSIICDLADSSVNVVSCAGVAESKRRG